MSGEVILGLRFRAKDLVTLQEHADRMESEGVYSNMISIMKRAAAATAKGEPLILVTTHAEEARVFAEGFTGYGVEQPTVEEVRL